MFNYQTTSVFFYFQHQHDNHNYHDHKKPKSNLNCFISPDIYRWTSFHIIFPGPSFRSSEIASQLILNSYKTIRYWIIFSLYFTVILHTVLRVLFFAKKLSSFSRMIDWSSVFRRFISSVSRSLCHFLRPRLLYHIFFS